MYVRLHRQKQRGKVYTSVQICESYRDPTKGNAPRNRVLVNLGPLERLGPDSLRRLSDGFARAAGEDVDGTDDGSLVAARDYGHVYAVGGVWDQLGLTEVLRAAGVDGGTSFGAARLIRLLVINRLCEPCSKWALLEWMDGVWHDEEDKPSYHHLLRAMDRLIDAKQAVEPKMATALLGEAAAVDLVFYDITSTYFEGDRSLREDDLRRFGYSRDRRSDRRQVVIGVVMTREGIPLCHHVFAGNTVDKATVRDVVADLKERFALRRVVFVGDRGMLSDPNLATLLTEELGFIVAHPLRRSVHAREVVGHFAAQFDRSAEDEQYFEDSREEVRFVVAHCPAMAREVRAQREERLASADAWIQQRLQRLHEPASRGRPPTVQGTYDRIRDYLRDRNLLGFYALHSTEDTLTLHKDREALAWEETIDGVLLLETTDATLSAREVVRRYKELAEIERGWRCLKSTLMVRPVYHWTEPRIRAHIFVCVLALQLERWMRGKLRDLSISVPRALTSLQRIKLGELHLGGKSVHVPTRPTDQQASILRCLGLPAIPKHLGGDVL